MGFFNFKVKLMWCCDLGLEMGCKKGDFFWFYVGYVYNIFVFKGVKFNYNFVYFFGLYR